ncbi:MAG: hypothetical protein NWF02_06600 [Candidatus Bathyarchaeota archaeon]|nr:hypothetical protein [Candidatus Bathyarchaeum sp.]
MMWNKNARTNNPQILMLAIGGIAGYFVGQMFRKISGMTLTLVVVAIVVIVFWRTGNLDLNLDTISAGVTEFMGVITPLGIIAAITSVPFAASFVACMFIGCRRY